MVLNDFGRMVDVEWLKTAKYEKNVVLDGMLLCLIIFMGLFDYRNNRSTPCHYTGNVQIKMEFGKPQSGSLSVIVGSFKSAVARQINLMRNTPGKKSGSVIIMNI